MQSNRFEVFIEECIVKALKNVVIKICPELLGRTPIKSKFDIAKVLFLSVKSPKELQLGIQIHSTILSLLLKLNAS